MCMVIRYAQTEKLAYQIVREFIRKAVLYTKHRNDSTDLNNSGGTGRIAVPPLLLRIISLLQAP